MTRAIVDHYRCPEHLVNAGLIAPLAGPNRYFKFGDNTLCFGQSSLPQSGGLKGPIDLIEHVEPVEGRLLLPFDPTQVVDNFRYERYPVRANSHLVANLSNSLLRDLYYLVRPFLGTSLRQPLQRVYLACRKTMSFPGWPVDSTVERLLETLLILFMKSTGLVQLPFIWFWPDGASSAAVVTHDVETACGLDFCDRVMTLDESFGIRSSFQVVPEGRYTIHHRLLDQIRSRGNEVNIQDFNHDGRLFWDRQEFQVRAKQINRYGREFGAMGFRAAVLYRNLDWFDQLEFEYDMSVPNVGHLEAQPGGCCTVFPYFIGDMLEIPVTTVQDYSLFHILRDYSLNVWQMQVAAIAQKHGLISFIVHPDYVIEPRAQETYLTLLNFLCEQRDKQGLWMTTAGEVNQWWRLRSQMSLTVENDGWRIEGLGKERARVAFAMVEGDGIVYSLADNRCAALGDIA